MNSVPPDHAKRAAFFLAHLNAFFVGGGIGAWALILHHWFF